MAEISPVRQGGGTAAATAGTTTGGGSAAAGGAPRGGSINSLGQTARDAAWNGLQNMGLSGARLQAVWLPLTQDVGANHYGPEASLSGDEQSRVQSLVAAAVGGGSQGAGGSSTTTTSSNSGSSGTSSRAGGAAGSGSGAGSSGAAGGGPTGTSGVTAADARTGTPPGMPGSLYRAADPTTLAAQKGVIVDTLRARGASDDDIRSVVAMAMVESESMTLAQRQSEKDHDPNPDARVYSPMNINSALLRSLGVDGSAQQALNGGSDAESLRRAANISYDGIKKYGLDGYLRQVRGGSSGIDAHGMQEYLDAVHNTRSLLASDPALLRDGRRYGQHVSAR